MQNREIIWKSMQMQMLNLAHKMTQNVVHVGFTLIRGNYLLESTEYCEGLMKLK